MGTFWQFIYNSIAVPALWAAFRAAAPFNRKIRRGIRGRRLLFERLTARLASLPPGKRIWFHASSMGEFEQAKPIIAELKRRHADARVIVSFFSPSGYEHSRNYPHADAITYLPFDTRRSARRFLDLVRPDAAVMVRYDIWPNHVWELRRRAIPSFIANATMRRQTPRRLLFARAFHRHVYDAFSHILTVSEPDRESFQSFGLTRPGLSVIGDTRYDQVAVRSADARRRHIIPDAVLAGRKVLVAGSTWPEDESVLLPALDEVERSTPGLLAVIVPHEPNEEHLDELEAALRGRMSNIRFSALNEYAGERVIIVDSVGILMVLYAHAHVAYIGGSFRQGVHNVLEAAVYGIPVVFGPRHRNSREPLLLVERGGAFVVSDSEELGRTVRSLLSNDGARTLAGGKAEAFVRGNVGATERFLSYLEPHLGYQGTIRTDNA